MVGMAVRRGMSVRLLSPPYRSPRRTVRVQEMARIGDMARIGIEWADSHEDYQMKVKTLTKFGKVRIWVGGEEESGRISSDQFGSMLLQALAPLMHLLTTQCVGRS